MKLTLVYTFKQGVLHNYEGLFAFKQWNITFGCWRVSKLIKEQLGIQNRLRQTKFSVKNTGLES